METPVPLDVSTREEFRQWLIVNHSTASSCWVRMDRHHPSEGEILYLDGLEEALCFGWIDSTQARLPDGGLVQRFSPRRGSGNFTELNKERCRRLERLGLMTDAGRAVSHMGEPFVIDDDIYDILHGDEAVWGNLLTFPDLYVRVRLYNIQHYRGSPCFRPRLEKFVDNTRRGVMYGEWNDGGRLV